MKPTITIRLPEQLKSELERIGDAEQKALSGIVREAIRHYVAIYRFRRLRGKVLPFAEAEGILTDEDIFNALS
jgi:predicted transcriptional regulator